MYTVVLVLVLAAVFYLVGLPLFRPDPEEEALLLWTPAPSADLERERVFGALAELEADYQMNKLSEADYRELKAEYVRQAAGYLKSAPSRESVGHKAGVDWSALEAEAEAEVALALKLAGEAGVAVTTAYCPHCGAQLLSAGQKFCHACGKMQRGEA